MALEQAQHLSRTEGAAVVSALAVQLTENWEQWFSVDQSDSLDFKDHSSLVEIIVTASLLRQWS